MKCISDYKVTYIEVTIAEQVMWPGAHEAHLVRRSTGVITTWSGYFKDVKNSLQ